MPTAFLAAMLACAIVVADLAGPTRAATTPPGAPVASGATVSISVTDTAVGRPVAPGFVGLSFEFPAVRDYTGSNPRKINPVLAQLIRDLAPDQTPVIRIGGNSTDQSVWPARGVQSNPGIMYTLTRSWLATTRALALDTGAKLIMGLNLKLDSAAEVKAESHAFATGIGRKHIAAFEIGNEPELYPITPWYGLAGLPVFPRPSTYNFGAYAQDVSGLDQQLDGSPLAGPATGNFWWLVHPRDLFRGEPNLKIVTYHRYPLIKCFTKPGDAGYPTIPNLLNADSSRQLAPGIQPYVGFAHSHGATFRIDELNSVACRGQEGVSNTFASALWVLDTLFSLARSGVDGVNIHTLPDAAYELFTFHWVRGHWEGTVRPEYYGLLMFTQAAPPGSRLLDVSSPASPDLRVRATVTPSGLIHVVLINDSLTAPHVLAVGSPISAKSAVLERLSAASPSATAGVTLGGQSFGRETRTGTLTGRFRDVQLTPVNGHYVIPMPPASAAMLTFVPAPPKPPKPGSTKK